ncbi:hypothetical protein QQX98_001326 [Neonectria punicea]|uniref:ATPase AAA-type core domain-containing protein n=1 Tax=Neonectria punicea TaxID=979145 RepID=A0ABR1HPX7_9HYPO
MSNPVNLSAPAPGPTPDLARQDKDVVSSIEPKPGDEQAGSNVNLRQSDPTPSGHPPQNPQDRAGTGPISSNFKLGKKLDLVANILEQELEDLSEEHSTKVPFNLNRQIEQIRKLAKESRQDPNSKPSDDRRDPNCEIERFTIDEWKKKERDETCAIAAYYRSVPSLENIEHGKAPATGSKERPQRVVIASEVLYNELEDITDVIIVTYVPAILTSPYKLLVKYYPEITERLAQLQTQVALMDQNRRDRSAPEARRSSGTSEFGDTVLHLNVAIMAEIDKSDKAKDNGFEDLIIPESHRNLLIGLVKNKVAESKSEPRPDTVDDISTHIDVIRVETALTEHTERAQRWGCVLLLDEADVFLTRRDWHDTNHNALVSVFLRQLEYCSGILFLTTNRVGVLDEAFKSRIHVSLAYPNIQLRETVDTWQGILNRIERDNKTASIKIKSDRNALLSFAKSHYKKHEKSGTAWNGRQIRNAFQLAIALGHHDRDKNLNAAGLTAEQAALMGERKSITEDRSFVFCSASFAARMHILRTSRSLQHAAYGSDPYIVETVSTLTQGGCMCLVRDEARTNPAELIDAIQELGVNWAMMRPSIGCLLPRN